MFPPKLVFLMPLCFSLFFFNLVLTNQEVSRDAMPSLTDCASCSPSTPIPGYPLYCPPPPQSIPGYPYPPPPPPPPPPPSEHRGQGKYPPTQPGLCCQYPQYPSPPGTYGYPQYPSPPGAAAGGYVPYPDDNHAASSSPLSIFLSVILMVLFSSAVFF